MKIFKVYSANDNVVSIVAEEEAEGYSVDFTASNEDYADLTIEFAQKVFAISADYDVAVGTTDDKVIVRYNEGGRETILRQAYEDDRTAESVAEFIYNICRNF